MFHSLASPCSHLASPFYHTSGASIQPLFPPLIHSPSFMPLPYRRHTRVPCRSSRKLKCCYRLGITMPMLSESVPKRWPCTGSSWCWRWRTGSNLSMPRWPSIKPLSRWAEQYYMCAITYCYSLRFSSSFTLYSVKVSHLTKISGAVVPLFQTVELFQMPALLKPLRSSAHSSPFSLTNLKSRKSVACQVSLACP